MVKKSRSNVKSRIHAYLLYKRDKSIHMVYVSKGTEYLVRDSLLVAQINGNNKTINPLLAPIYGGHTYIFDL